MMMIIIMMVMMRMFTTCNAQVMCENIKKLYSNTLHAFRPIKFFCFLKCNGWSYTILAAVTGNSLA